VEPSPVAGDPDRLRQVAGILVDNAVRHSPSGGVVTIRTREPGLLEVLDEGPGIPAEDRERVFQRFWRRPGSPPGGHGLGLAIARSIAEHHGGTVQVVDRPGPGACLRLSLPATPSV
jgi:signal transduction histidine kinase